MQILSKLSQTELKELYIRVKKEYDKTLELKLRLDISRGKPNGQQLDLCNGLMTCLDEYIISKYSFDYRNYGVMDGVPESKEMFAPLLGVPSENTIVCGNSSLNIMYDCIVRAMLLGVLEGKTPWSQLPEVKFLCPSPGYDRHFAICEEFGIKMITVKMTENGPDMDEVEKLVSGDSTIKGMWCVPKYSNPQGITYSDETVKRLARLKPAADDFRIFWDNAYCIHDLYDDSDKLLNIMDECIKAGTEDMPYLFFSTSKISFAGSGVAAMGGSKANIEWQKKRMTIQTISYDKINQLRHVLYFKDSQGLKEHMKKHAEILRPKFETVLDAFDRELMPFGCVSYVRPRGGYFISLDVEEGCAKRTIQLCKEAGVMLTPAGSTYPYKIDPEDKNIRIAPSYLEVEDLEKAICVLCSSVKLACIEKYLIK